ncbi:2'-5' RNA ligase [Virgibacillus natechei]|uniref:RNA 2',3'-cyclic phosphodiesterase n=1 Tax=Virgibacillus natechei TaxID=1216297 RepID=A0ABS4IDC9_9BACI|nr:RNA 2',3'-cyclic phosphodiesterase [Virgibacillus natechei]MBP1968938.1 2'-5' RNA ligase [Virgibacillus natechei]UZD11729.1 RNA 2',3'-cyclic phosphodiesterase [Virgibacillus natechei]
MSKNPHYFIAIRLPGSLKENLSKWQHELKKDVSFKQWPHFEDLHITLKFLGEVDDTKLRQLKEELKTIEDEQAFSIAVGGIGVFGNPKKPRVLWAGVDKTKSLAHLQEYVEACTMKVGFNKENRPYRPHITLAKKWSGETVTTIPEALKERFSNKKQIEVEEVVLYQIHPGSTVKYEMIARYRLKRGEMNGSVN